MQFNEIKGVIENLLLVTDQPLTIKKIIEVLDIEITHEDIKRIMNELIDNYKGRGIHIIEIAMGYQFATREIYADWIKKFQKIEKGNKLSQAALETLAIIAYKQPITRIEIDTIRGVESSGIVKSLLDKKLIRSVGRKKVIGKPMMLGTHQRFLDFFGLKSLADLPSIEDFASEQEKIMLQKQQNEQRQLPFANMNDVKSIGKIPILEESSGSTHAEIDTHVEDETYSDYDSTSHEETSLKEDYYEEER